MKITLLLQPMDVWLFRDGRPFDAGSAHRAESLFPPYPTVIQGAFRTHRLLLRGVNLKDQEEIREAVGGSDDYGELKLRGPYLARRENGQFVRYLPQPADAIVEKKGVKSYLTPAILEKPVPDLKTGQALSYLFGLKQESDKQDEPLWLSQDTLMRYHEGQKVEGVESKTLFTREDRVGIAMGAARVVDEGMLYEAGFVRPCEGVGLLVDMEGYDDPEWQQPGILHLGGEKRMAALTPVTVEGLPSPLVKTGRFKVYFATPTYFEGGWQPADWGRFFAMSVELVGAAIHRYETLGGFNLIGDPNSADAHRPARRFVPAGSVYYFEGSSQLKPNLTQEAITDFGAEIGFGQIIIKEW